MGGIEALIWKMVPPQAASGALTDVTRESVAKGLQIGFVDNWVPSQGQVGDQKALGKWPGLQSSELSPPIPHYAARGSDVG